MFAGLTLALLTSLFIFQTAKTQNILFHLLGNSTPTVYFALPTQNFSEMNGAWIDWPAGLLSWSKRRAISLTGPATTLSNFPVLVALDSTRIDYATTAAGGTDLRFTLDDGTALPYEIENWDSAGTSHVWVTLPTYTAYPAQTRIWMYHGNPTAANAQNASATWGTSHIGVWHLDGDAVDSSGGARNGTNTGATGATGLSGRAMAFTGTSTYIRLPDTMISNKTTATFEAWVKTSSSDAGVIGWGNSAYPAAPASYVPTFYFGNDGLLRAEQWHGASTPITTPTAQNDDEWKHLVLVVEPNSQSLYVNGTLIQTSAVTASTINNTANYIGLAFTSSWPATAGSWRGLTGLVDEVRFSNVARSSAWVQQTYQSMRDLVAFYGPEENQNSGKAMISVVLSSISENTITVPYTVTGTSSQGADHNRAAGSITFAPGTVTANLNTRIFRDNLVEGNETLILTLQTGTGYDVGGGGTHTVTIVDEPLVPPNGVDDTFNLTTLSPTNLNVLTNDTDDNSDPLVITSFTNPAHGTLVRVGQLLLYTPDGDFPATDTFTYTISDGRGGSDTATVTLNYQIPFTWTGLGGDANWSTPANWLGGAVPNPTDSVYFNNQCSTNCNPIIDSAAEILGLQMNSSFPGTLTQAATMIVRDRGWIQRAGAFVGAIQNITITHPMRVLGGTFQSTAGELRLGSALTSRTLMEFAPGASFAHNNGVVYFDGRQPGCVPNQTLTLDLSPSITLYNATFYGDNNSSCGYSGYALAAGDTLLVQNELRLNGGRLDGNYELKGDLIIAGGFGGNGTITVNGSGEQTYRWSASPVMSRAPNITIDKSSGSFRPFLGNNTLHTGRFLLLNGVFESPSATFDVLYRASSDTIFQISSGATYEDGNGAISIYGAQPGCVSDQTFTIDVPNNHNFQSLTLTGNNDSSCGRSQLTLVPGRKVIVTGSLTHSGAGGIHGTFDILGNLSTSANGGSASFNFLGTAAQQISAAANSLPTGTMTINKASGTVTQVTSTSWPGTGAVNVTSGILNLAGFNLTVAGTLNVAAAGRIICAGGAILAGSSNIEGELSCGSSLGITWTGLAGDGMWNTPGNWTNNTVPGNSDIAFFNGICSGPACDVSVQATRTVRGVMIHALYAGTITQPAATNLTIGTGGWTQSGGTYLGSDGSITSTGSFSLSGGKFRATSGLWTQSANISFAGGTFLHNSGTVRIAVTASFLATNVLLHNFSIEGNNRTLTISGSVDVAGTLTLADTATDSGPVNGGTINVTGNIVLQSFGKYGTTLIRLVGNTDQSLASLVAMGRIPNLEIASEGGTVTLTGSILPRGNFTYISGDVDASSSHIQFQRDQTITPGPIVFADVTFGGSSNAQTLIGTMKVLGTLTLADTASDSGPLNTGIIELSGNIVLQNQGKYGTALIRLVGTTDQSLTAISTTGRLPNFEIASEGGTVTLAGTFLPRGNFTYTSGVVDASISHIQFLRDQTITPGPIVFADVTFGGYSYTQTLTGNMTVLGTLTFNDTSSSPGNLNGFQILSYGDITATSYGKRGSTVIRMLGTADRTMTGTTSAYLPPIEIDTSGGTTSLVGGLTFTTSLSHLGGIVDAGTSVVRFPGTGTFRPGDVEWASVTFAGYQSVIGLGGETVKINGTLTFADTASSPGYVNLGTLEAKGDVAFTNYGKRGTASLRMSGSTLTNLSTANTPRMLETVNVVAKTGGAETRLANSVAYSITPWGLNVTSGLMNLNSHDLTISGSLTVGAGATLRCNGGEFSAGSTSFSGTIECPGYPTYPYNWTGNAGDGNLFTAANWQGLQVPPADAVVVFNDAHCGANCNANIPAATTLRGILMEAGYTGTISQAPGATISIGIKGHRQYGGTFLGSDAAITIDGPVQLQGGTFRSTSGILYSRSNVSIANTFQHNGGTWRFSAPYLATRTLSLGATAFRHVTFYSNNGFDAYTLTITGTPSVLGDLEFQRMNATNSGTLNGGTLLVHGNITVQASNYLGSMAVRLVGNSDQTVHATTATSHVPNLEIASTGGIVSITGTPVFFRNFTHTTGTVSLTAPSITLLGAYNSTYTFNAPTIAFNDVAINSANAHDIVTYNFVGELNVNGNLTLSSTSVASSLNSGTIRVRGNLAASGTTAWNGTAMISLEGTANSTISQVATTTFGNGPISVNKASASVTQLTAISPRQNMTISAGSTYNMGGFNLAVTGSLTNNGVLSRGTSPACGTLSTGSFAGTPAVCPPP